jgi:flagellar basal body-associated protein FliL
MKIQKSKSTKRIFPALILAVVLLTAAAIGAYTYLGRNSSENASLGNGSDTSTPNSQSDNEQSQNLDEDPALKEESPNSDRPVAPVSDDENKKQVPMIASVDTSDSSVYIRGGVNYPVSNGSCYALLQGPNGKTLRKETSILPSSASTDCKTISIAKNELSPGKWTFKLYYSSNEYEGVSNEVSFNI